MAMSFSRPDPASPAQVADASFATGRRGYDQHEVRDFLRMVSAELSRLHERERFLERELQTAQAAASGAPAHLDDETLTRMLGEETARVLHAARESAAEIRDKAEQSAARMLLEASDETTRMREEAEIESSRRRADAANDAEAELSMAKQQGREMVNEARAYRERVLSELARRRELAREQIEQLIHGRDRLMQAFERARLVAVDVVAEMQPLGEPDEYVDLTPSTGPVPVMVARADMARNGGPVDSTPDGATEAEAEAEAEADGDDSVDSSVDTGGDVEVDAEATVNGLHVVYDEGRSDADHRDSADVESIADFDATVDAAVADDVSSKDLDDAHTSEVAERASVNPDDGSVDDVVVDLFARLRANDVPTVEPENAPRTRGDEVDGDTAGDVPSAEDVDIAENAKDADLAEVDAQVELDVSGDDNSETDEVVGPEATLFDQRSADLTPLIVSSARKLKRVLADEQNEVLDALRRSQPVRTLDDVLPVAAEHAQRYASVIGDDLLLAAHAGASLLDTEHVAKLSKAAGKQAVQHASEMISRWLVEPLRDRLDRCVSEGHGDNAAITKKVRATYREFKTEHIDGQLDDVVRAAHSQGLVASVKTGTSVQWTPDPSQKACADCDDNRLAGPLVAGTEFPTGHVCTPAHPGCRCMLLPTAR
jgi:DivIVA domain-containing protein